jgi:uncharacterized membrane protein YgdD (TMEM256/DUF423 family)
MTRGWLAIGAISAALSVAAGAFGAHALKAALAPDALAVWETAARYQMYHALALLAVGLADRASSARPAPSRAMQAAGWLFVAGTVLFSGSLYALALSGIRTLGAVTPLGGVAFIAGWGCLAWAALRAR